MRPPAPQDADGAGLPIVQYWHAEPIPSDVAALIESFRECNPGMRHLLFDEVSALGLIEERFGAREAAAFAACAEPAMQSDYLRYCAILHHGGVYADADLDCVAPLSGLLDAIDAGILLGWPQLPPRWRTPYFEGKERVGEYRVVLTHLFAFASPGHPLLQLALEIATTNIENRVAEEVGAVTGPLVLTSLYLLRELGSFERFVDYAEDGVFEPSARLICEAIGDYARIERGFEGVRVAPMTEANAWIRAPRTPLAYKETGHWADVTSSIYR